MLTSVTIFLPLSICISKRVDKIEGIHLHVNVFSFQDIIYPHRWQIPCFFLQQHLLPCYNRYSTKIVSYCLFKFIHIINLLSFLLSLKWMQKNLIINPQIKYYKTNNAQCIEVNNIYSLNDKGTQYYFHTILKKFYNSKDRI